MLVFEFSPNKVGQTRGGIDHFAHRRETQEDDSQFVGRWKVAGGKYGRTNCFQSSSERMWLPRSRLMIKRANRD